MANAVPSFPLLHLPNNALMNVLRNMMIVEQLGFSLCSENSKALIISLSRKLSHCNIGLGNNIGCVFGGNEERYFHLSFFVDESPKWLRGRNEQPMKLPMPEFVTIRPSYSNITYKWRKEGYTVKDWIQHIFTIFHISCITRLGWGGNYNHIFEVGSLCHAIHGLDIGRMVVSNVHHPSRKYFQLFESLQHTKTIILYCNPFENKESFYKVLMQNFDHIHMTSVNHEPPSLKTLNELLAINSKEVSIHSSGLSVKDLNSFFKHWINGSNPELRYLRVLFSNWRDMNLLNETVVMRGINYHKVSDDKERIPQNIDEDRHFMDGGLYPSKIKGGLDIERNDGTKATVILKSPFGGYCQMFVWN